MAKTNNIKRSSDKADALFAPVLFLILGYFLTVAFCAFYGDIIISSDSSADLILARLLNRDGGFLSKQFIYSTELIVLDTQFIFKPAFALFPNDWHKARVLAHAVLMAIYLGSMIGLVKASRLGPKGFWSVAFCAFPIGLYYTVNMSWSMFYTVNAAISFLMLIVLMIALHNKKDKMLLFSFLLFFVSFLSGVRTLRTIVQVNIPLILTALIMLGCRKFKKLFKLSDSRVRDCDKNLTIYSFVMFFGACAGYLFNECYLSKRFIYTQYASVGYRHFSIGQLIDAFSDFVACYGWHSDISLISAQGISASLGLVMGALVVLAIVLLFFRFSDRLSDEEYLLVLFTLVTVALCCFVISHITVCFPYHWVPVVPFGYICLAIAIKHLASEFKAFQSPRYGMLVGIFAFLVSLNWILVPLETADDARKRQDLIDAVTELEGMGYNRGMATFWNSNVVTELTDGRVEMWAVEDLGDLHPFCWLQDISHAQLPEGGDVFLILTEDEYKTLSDDVKPYVVMERDYYSVLVFDGEDDYVSILSDAYIGTQENA